MTHLFLDDIRMPAATANYMLPVDLRPMYRNELWVIVRNYDAFVRYINLNGLPDVVSFDHDLATSHYEGNWESGEPTGYDCAKWMVQYCIDNDLELPDYYVHSMNPIGTENIKNLLDNYAKERRRKREEESKKEEHETEDITDRSGTTSSGTEDTL